ncbi:MAG: 4-(cytidine 5'-diphospho)-2-C-methyl-D-erythritol kinase [Pseudomonadota bacterium]
MDAPSRTVVRHEIARPKVNLALHVLGQRADGYHTLDSLVAFAALDDGVGDRLAVTFQDGAARAVVSVDGPFAADLPEGPRNIAAAAAEATGGIAAIHLTKNIPVASGIGGGSADAAAVLRAAAARRQTPPAAFHTIAASLGADVPVCLEGTPCRMEGVGAALTPVRWPSFPCLLVNPGVPVETPAVFKALAGRFGAPLPNLPAEPTATDALQWLYATRNDLAGPAIACAPVIDDVIAALSALPGAKLTRMSGSGATVFSLFDTAGAASAAAAALRATAPPTWWIAPATLEGSPDRSD